MRTLIISFAVLSSLFLSSCSKQLVNLTPNLISNYNWGEPELKKIQFYLSKDIILTREVSTGESVISGGKITIKDGKKVEQVTVKAGTPGALLFQDDKQHFAVSFESVDSRFLMFGSNPQQKNQVYTLLGKNWNNHVGTVTYDGKEYQTGVGTGLASLLVNMKRIRKMEVDSRTAKGRKVD